MSNDPCVSSVDAAALLPAAKARQHFQDIEDGLVAWTRA